MGLGGVQLNGHVGGGEGKAGGVGSTTAAVAVGASVDHWGCPLLARGGRGLCASEAFQNGKEGRDAEDLTSLYLDGLTTKN